MRAVLIALVLVVAPTTATAFAAGSTRDCGDIRGSADAPKAVRVAGVTCARGKALAEAHWLVSGRFDRCARRRRTCTLQGFRCVRVLTGARGARIACTRGADRVRFRYRS